MLTSCYLGSSLLKFNITKQIYKRLGTKELTQPLDGYNIYQVKLYYNKETVQMDCAVFIFFP